MLPLDNQHREPPLEEANDIEKLESQLNGLRRQISGLQRDAMYLEERIRNLKLQRVLVHLPTPTVSVVASKEAVRWPVMIVLLLSLLLVYGGQFILLRTNGSMPDEGIRQALAGGMLIAGALLFGAYMPRASNFLPRIEFPSENVSSNAFVWRNRWTLRWLFASVLLAIVAILLFITVKENLLVILLWLASILTLGISQTPNLRITRPYIKRDERLYVAGLMMLLVIALITRVYHLAILPYNIDGDFASVGLQARALLIGEQKQIFTFGWAAIPMLGYLPSWLSMALFGNNWTGLNASGVIEGLLMIVGVYWLGRDLFHTRVGLIAAALMTISYAHLAASRQSVYIDPAFFLLFAIYFLFVGIREGRGFAIVVSGLLTAFCLQVYYPSRIIFFIVGAMLLYLLLFRQNWIRARWWTILLWGLATLVALGPMLVVFAQNIDAFMSRTREVFILSPEVAKHMQGVYRVNTVSALLLQQARHTALIFHYYTDTGTQFGFQRPLLDPFLAPLFTLGLGYALFQRRQFGAVLVLVWTVLGVIFGCFFTGNPPFWGRLMILLPPTMILAALALNVIYEVTNRGLEQMSLTQSPIALVALLLCLTWVGIQNWNTYVELKGTYATARTFIARYLAGQPPSTHAYLVSEGFRFNDREFEFFAPGRLVANLTPEQVEEGIPSVGPSTLLIVTADQGDLVQRLQEHFPSGSVEPHMGNSSNEIVFFAFRLP